MNEKKSKKLLGTYVLHAIDIVLVDKTSAFLGCNKSAFIRMCIRDFSRRQGLKA